MHDSRPPWPRRYALPTLFVFAHLPALADPVVTLTQRESVSHVHHFGAFAVVSHHGYDGSDVPVTALDRANALALQGAGSWTDDYGAWHFSYQATWQLAQDFALEAGQGGLRTLVASGSTDLTLSSQLLFNGGVVGPLSSYLDGTNSQQFEFTLSEPTAYALEGFTQGGQSLSLARWDGSSWVGIGEVSPPVTVDRNFDINGTLDAGLYRLRSQPGTHRADDALPAVDAAWLYALNFPAVAAVPEPVSGLLLPAGLGVVGLWLRRRGVPA